MIESAVRLNETKPLPDAWQWVRLGELCGDAETRDPRLSPDMPFRYIDISGVDATHKQIIGARTILGKDAPSRARQAVKMNDILIATTRPNLNAVALVPAELDGEICSTGFCVLRPANEIDPLFLFLFVQTNDFVRLVSGEVRGMLYPAVTDTQVRAISIPLPPLPEQKRIAAKIQELMAEMERARTACEDQLEAAKALPLAYLRQVFESEEAKKWERKRLGEICEVIMGQSPPGDTYNRSGEGLAFFQGKFDFGEMYPTVSSWCTHPQKIAESGDVLISVRAPVGPTNLCNQRCCIGRGLAAIRSRNNVEPFFVLYFLRFIEEKVTEAGQGSTFGAIKRDYLEGISVSLPPLATQQRIAAELQGKMAGVEKLKASIEKQLEAIKALPQVILRKAFRGEL